MRTHMFAKKVTEEAFFEIENAARKVFFFPCLLFFLKKKERKITLSFTSPENET